MQKETKQLPKNGQAEHYKLAVLQSLSVELQAPSGVKSDSRFYKKVWVNYNIDNLQGDNFKSFKNDTQSYYKDYLQGRVIKNKDIGDISLTRKGLDETQSKNFELGITFPDLPKNLKNANYIETNPLYKFRRDKTTEKFHTLFDGQNRQVIAQDKFGNKKYYFTKRNTANQGTPSKTEGTSFDNIPLDYASAYSNQNQALETKSNSIIPNNPYNFNPNHVAIPGNSVFTGSVQKNVDINGNEINFPIDKNRIFTREDIGAMTGDEYIENENAIREQWGKIGIPTNGDMEREMITNGTVMYVKPYTRQDGRKVKGYYRSLK